MKSSNIILQTDIDFIENILNKAFNGTVEERYRHLDDAVWVITHLRDLAFQEYLKTQEA